MDHIEEFPQKMFSPIGKKAKSGKSLFHFEAGKQFPVGWKVTDFDDTQKLVEVEDDKGERSWLSLALLFKQINFTKSIRIKQIDETMFSVKFHSVGSFPKKNKENLFLIFEAE